MQKFDLIIAGGGAAGLSLACYLVNSPLARHTILIVDRVQKNQNDRTWCFWNRESTLFDAIAYRSWNQFQFVSEDFQRVYPLAPYTYRMIRGIDFYNFAQQQLAAHPNVTFLQGNLQAVQDGPDQAQVQVDGQVLAGDWVFDSTFDPAQFKPDLSRYHYLKQHFKGWVIEAPADLFQPDLPTLFDFRTPQYNEMRFLYVLPFSTRQALVEYTLFSAELLTPQAYMDALRDYLRQNWGLEDYRLLEEESGIIPMTDQPFPRRNGQRILNIGTKGGRVKPSSGYAFLRIQRQSAEIVQSLLQQGHPFHLSRPAPRYSLFDSLMLQVMHRRGKEMKGIFAALFKNNPVERIFRFLDEEATWPQDVQLLTSLPPAPFLQAWVKTKLLRQI